jgi:hypothetical protein
MALDAHAAEVAASFEHFSAHEDADADEQEQYDDDEQGHGVLLSVGVGDKKAPEPTKPARATISCRSFDVRCWQMRTFRPGHFGSE